MTESKEKYNIMFVKEWLVLRPQFKQLYCPETFVPMARRLCDKKDFLLFSIIKDFPKTGEEMYIEHFDSNQIHVDYAIHDFITGAWKGFGKIEINDLP